jgi:hypothetical protein
MRRLLFVILIAISSYLIVSLPFLLKLNDPLFGFDFSAGSVALWQNYDGPNYIVIAKSWYDPEIIRANFSLPLPLEYYPAHFPFYPATIWLLDLIMPGPWAMLVSTALGYVIMMVAFYWFVKPKVRSKLALWLVAVLALFPARWIILRAVGSPEPWFLAFIILSLGYFDRRKWWLSSIMACLAILTKSPGVLLPIAYGMNMVVEYLRDKKINWNYLWYSLTPLTVLALFGFYALRTGDFWAYFNSGDNFHIFWPPFSIFSNNAGDWVGSFWLEDIIYIWLIFGAGVWGLKRMGYRMEFLFASLFWGVTLFVSHRDISRYIMPILPLVVLGYKDILNQKWVRVLILVLAVPSLVFAWNYILHNREMIVDWTAYL